MDKDNLADMLAIRPDDASASADLMLEYSDRYQELEIPDPYFGNDGFELVFDMIEDAARGLLRQIRSRHDL
jgi:protein-tyrosine phosphatase